jgi:signal peptidase II
MSVLVMLFDQVTKTAVLAFISTGDAVRICSFANLVLILNRGTSFGLLEPDTMIEFYMIIGLTICCVTFLIYCFWKFKSLAEKMLLGIIIGGAIGNLLDRFVHGAVIDFIDLHYGTMHWPAFNLADAAVSCGAILLVLINLFSKHT